MDLPLDQAFLAEALGDAEVDAAASQARLRATVNVVADNVLVRGWLKGSLTVPCGACLEPALLPLDTRVSFTYVPSDSSDEGEPDEDADSIDDVDFAHHDGVLLDLAPELREALILAVPYAPRCEEDCRGLCPHCGENRNRVDCGHAAGVPDPRFSTC